MRESTRRRLIWGFLGVIILTAVIAGIIAVHLGQSPNAFDILSLSFPIVGAVIATRQPDNTMGWIMLGIGAAEIFSGLLSIYAAVAVKLLPGSLPWPGVALGLAGGLWVPFIGMVGTFFLLLFPDGHLPTPRWRPWAWFCAISMILVYSLLTLIPTRFGESGYPGIRNPMGIEALRPIEGPLVASVFLIPIGIVGCAVALVRRFRRSHGQERLQLKWFTACAGLLAFSYLLVMAINLPSTITNRPSPGWVNIVGNIAIFPFVLIPLVVGIAILKYHLYDIDLVINKTVVFGVLAAFISAVYVAIVVGVGALVGSGGKPNLGLSILATAIVAVAFQPVRERVQHFANRLVYGKRATPYEVLAEFSGKVAGTYASSEILPQMARTIAEGTGARDTGVWLKSRHGLRLAAAWPQVSSNTPAQALPSDGELPPLGDVSRAVPVRHQGELLGALTVTKPAGEPLTPAEEKLLDDLAGQAGLVLRNVGLTDELFQRLDELKASRQRLVAAQDETRRRLERDLHDGAQRQLVTLKGQLAVARASAPKDPKRTKEILGEIKIEAGQALEALRDLARGIYPPLLADQGLAAALEAQARKARVPTEVSAEEVSRYPQPIEAAIYFCTLEALQNAAKHARASKVTIELKATEAWLDFSVSDDGMGFDPERAHEGSGLQNMSDRLEALGGQLSFESSPGRGTTVSGRLPIGVLEPA